MSKHKSGFVNIIGKPNVGKSTLVNALMGDKMSIATSKPQTTRHRILAIYNEEQYQIVFSDSPGIIAEPRYKMQSSMNRFAKSSFEDADILLVMTDTYSEMDENMDIITRLKRFEAPSFLVINKIDQLSKEQIEQSKTWWREHIEFEEIFEISALKNLNITFLFEGIKAHLPEFPPYFPKDQMSDRPERFFVSELIREQIFLQYKQEIPYSCEVAVETFKEPEYDGDVSRIRALIFVSRKSQKQILIGKGGEKIKKLGIASRKSIEAFIGTRVYLELFVKVKENWRDNERDLKYFGYKAGENE